MDASGGVIPTASAQTFLHGAVSWINMQRTRDCGVADTSSQHNTVGLAPVDVDTLTLLPPPDKTAIEVVSLPDEDGRVALPEVVALVVSTGGGTITYLLQQDADGSVKACLPCFAENLTLTSPLHTSYSLLARLQIFDVSSIDTKATGSYFGSDEKPIGVCEMMTEEPGGITNVKLDDERAMQAGGHVKSFVNNLCDTSFVRCVSASQNRQCA
jgi:hypothetical protein